MPDREPLLADVIGLFVGLTAIVVAILSLGNNIQYPPNDTRSQPWFDPVVTAVMVLSGVIVIIVASIRLIQGLRDRPK